jgi:hypothetical protein
MTASYTLPLYLLTQLRRWFTITRCMLTTYFSYLFDYIFLHQKINFRINLDQKYYYEYCETDRRKEHRPMIKIIYFGEDVDGYDIPVLNEREIRAAAGLLFLIMFISILVVVLKGDFLLLKYAITIFLTDILIRVFVNPKFSPSLIIGRLIVRNQVPEYVGAQQKRFAWIIGVVLATITFIHIAVLNARSPITGIICLICLIFLFFETAFGICLGCKFYSVFYKEKIQYCPGEVCDVKSKQEIQKTSKIQLFIVLGFITYLFLIVFLFNNNFSREPNDLFENVISTQAK